MQAAKHNSPKVLLVYSEEVTRYLLQEKLVMKGCIARAFASGLDGMLQGRIEKFDWVVSGLDLPVVTGLEMVRALRLNPTNKNSPVLFLGDGCESAACRRLIDRLGATLMKVGEFADEGVERMF
jgi:CheY-like chemotaxis protein